MGKIEELIEELENVSSKSINKDFEDGYNGGIRHALELAKEYKSSLPTQQDKVVVPEFVAEYLEMRKDQFQIGGLGVAIMHVFDAKESPKLFNWMNNNVEIFARAWLDGYTVEKEQLYWIYDPIADQYLGYDRAEGKVWWLLKQNDGARAELTDEEITKVGEQYRAFAVPVEEEAE
ncbi:DUF1642 domain-containing protein [Enterococcus sp. AZ177]|uniref:DUF1642 domain-containing protein n=1 Tax=unclassified Enterococcus TaxID=2608891 RepID=UPI003D2FE8E8